MSAASLQLSRGTDSESNWRGDWAIPQNLLNSCGDA